MRYWELLGNTPVASPDVMEGHNINELAGVKRFRDMPVADVLSYFKSQMGNGPVTMLGKGAHGAAFMIGNNVYKMWMQDSAYQAFVNYALQHQDNPFLPKFYSGIKQMPAFFIRGANAPDKVNFIKMEKLSGTEFEVKQYTFDLNYTMNDSISEARKKFYTTVSWSVVTQLLLRPNVRGNEMQVFLKGLKHEKGYEYTEDDLSPALKLFIETIKGILQLNRDLDLFADNFMMRGDQLVIVDPIYDNDDYLANRDFVYGFDNTYSKPAVTSNHVRKSIQQTDSENDSDY